MCVSVSGLHEQDFICAYAVYSCRPGEGGVEREEESEKEEEGDAADLLTDAMIAEANSSDVDSFSQWPV